MLQEDGTYLFLLSTEEAQVENFTTLGSPTTGLGAWPLGRLTVTMAALSVAPMVRSASMCLSLMRIRHYYVDVNGNPVAANVSNAAYEQEYIIHLIRVNNDTRPGP